MAESDCRWWLELAWRGAAARTDGARPRPRAAWTFALARLAAAPGHHCVGHPGDNDIPTAGIPVPGGPARDLASVTARTCLQTCRRQSWARAGTLRLWRPPVSHCGQRRTGRLDVASASTTSVAGRRAPLADQACYACAGARLQASAPDSRSSHGPRLHGSRIQQQITCSGDGDR